MSLRWLDRRVASAALLVLGACTRAPGAFPASMPRPASRPVAATPAVVGGPPSLAPSAVSSLECPGGLVGTTLPLTAGGAMAWYGGGVGLAEAGGALTMWLPEWLPGTPDRASLSIASLAAGAPASSEPTSLGSLVTLTEGEGFSLAANGALVGLVATRWTGPTPVITWTVRAADGTFAPLAVLDPSPLPDADPAIAAGPPGVFAVVWRRGTYPSQSVELALVDAHRAAAPEVLVRHTLETTAEMEGPFAVVYTGAGYFVAYLAGPTGGSRGLIGLLAGSDGSLRGRRVIFDDPTASAPVAAWDGAGLGVAFGWHGLGFLRLAGDGSPLLSPGLIAADDRGGEFVPTSMVFSGGMYVVGAAVEYANWPPDAPLHGTPAKTVAVGVRPDGLPLGSVTLSTADARSLPGPVLAVTPAGVVATTQSSGLEGGVGDYGTEVVSCVPPSPRSTPACATHAAPPRDGRFAPLARHFSLSPLAADALVVDDESSWSDAEWSPPPSLSRMTLDGLVTWSIDLPKDASQIVAAATAVEVAATWVHGDDLLFATYDARSGAARLAPVVLLHHTGNVCLTPDAAGYLLATQGSDGKSLQTLHVDSSGKVAPRSSLPRPWFGCALVTTGTGYLFAYEDQERPGLTVQPLDGHGAPTGSVSRVDAEGSPSPRLAVQDGRYYLAFAAPISPTFGAAELADDGHPLATFAPTTEANLLLGFGLVEDGGQVAVGWATALLAGTSRLCTH